MMSMKFGRQERPGL